MCLVYAGAPGDPGVPGPAGSVGPKGEIIEHNIFFFYNKQKHLITFYMKIPLRKGASLTVH